ncbi:hypothetical protein RSAG8_10275, partial [Rhizoctonia solani AG-8 WAC10335]
MFFTRFAFAAIAAALAAASPIDEVQGQTLAKREASYSPDLVTDQGNRFKVHFGSTDGHPNATPNRDLY